MEDQQSDDWLPPGWKVEARQRRSGKKDKCYYAPCGELRFFSRAEVSRYLDNCGSKTEEKEKGSGKQSSKNITVEKAAAEGLPPGWTKEVRITKRANRVRKDPFYTDPVSGYVFRSMKDALRYVETGELGRLAFKPKDKGSNDEDFEDDNICEPAIVEGQKVAVNGTTDETEKQSAEQVSNLSGRIKEEEMLTSASTGGQTSLSKHTPDQHKGAELSSLILSEAKGSEQIGVKDSKEGVHASGNVVGVLLDKQSRENGMTKDETEKTQEGRGKTKLKKALNIPRRASKRLAGVALDPTPEIKTTRARRSSIKQLSEIVPDAAENSFPVSCIHRASKQPDQLESALETSFAFDASKSKELILAPNNILSPWDMLAVNSHVGNLETKDDEDKGVLPLGNAANPGVHSGKVERDKASDVLGSLVDMPLADLWTDPCIAFAIQTLTGIPCDTPKISESNSSKVPGVLATPEVHAERDENGYRSVEKHDCGINMPIADPAIQKEHAGKVEKGQKTDETLWPSLDMPMADIWADPCIEFAIKTLTGAIPVEYDLENQDYFKQQPSSSLTQSNKVKKRMQIQVKCSCGAENCPEWAIIELQGVVEVQPSFQDSLQNLRIGQLCRPSSQENYTFTVGYHELTGSKVALKKPMLVLKKIKCMGTDQSDEATSSSRVELDVVGIIRHKILFKNRPKALISGPQPVVKGKANAAAAATQKQSV
ncbi:methyl-CpG-binding domain-containing protein 13-like isoform X2 [Durio zibethinus]|uniref:Methyl-CpG-binding domain-containing protein 13-like isoform X2 n=1 Tax=Durio zibethinus TaxID=66656 RepID=A0A6P6AJ30_DURZI|nr:methyl-CpG-binding domain-containing protein 13-like isoform X2 [Durio zibethinus]